MHPDNLIAERLREEGNRLPVFEEQEDALFPSHPALYPLAASLQSKRGRSLSSTINVFKEHGSWKRRFRPSPLCAALRQFSHPYAHPILSVPAPLPECFSLSSFVINADLFLLNPVCQLCQ